MTSSTAPGVTHRWTNLRSYADEVAQARIWAGFHYRFSTVVGQDMGRKIGQHVVRSVMQPATLANYAEYRGSCRGALARSGTTQFEPARRHRAP